jgi:hypothetical protein
MLARIQTYRPSHAAVVAYLALFVALGGSGYAAVKINGKNIKNRTVAGKKLKRDTLGGKEIRESRLGTVPAAAAAQTAASAQSLEGLHASAFLRAGGKAADADKLDGQDASSFRDRCPGGTTKFGGACIESTVRAISNSLNGAGATCAAAGGRLPTFPELTAFAVEPGVELGTGSSGDNQWEWTSSVYNLPPAGLTVADRPSGTLTYDPFTIVSPIHFRCVLPLTN